MERPNLSSWEASVPAGSPIGTIVGRTQNYGGPAATFSVSAKGGRSFAAYEEGGWVLLTTAGPMVEGGASPVVITARNAAGSSQRTCTVTVTPRVVVDPPPVPEPVPEPPPVVVEPPPLPPPPSGSRAAVRPSYPARAVRLRLIGRGGTRVALGAQVMPAGWWSAGQGGCLRTLAATRAGLAPGSLIRTQIDCHHRHPDGSAKLLLLAAEATLEAGEVCDVVLEPGATHNAPGEPLAWSTLAAQHTIRAEVLGSVLDGLGVEPGYWRNGPLVVERRAHNPRGGGSRRLVLDVRYCADGTATADAQFCNDVALDGGGGWDGECRLTLDGAVWTSGSLHHPIYSRLRATLSTREPGHVMFQDVDAMIDAGVIPSLDLRLGVPAETITSILSNAAASRGAPYAAAGITRYMPMTGGRMDIGQIPGQHAAYLLSGGSVQMHDLLEDMVTAGHGIPWHAWDRATSSPIMCVGTRARRWMDYRDKDFQPAQEETATNGGWNLDLAHKPSLGWVPFLATGSRAALDLVQSEAAWAVVCRWHDARAASPDGLNIMNTNQLRGSAWGMRDLARGAWASPDTGPGAAPALAAYLRQATESNLGWLLTQRAAWEARYGETAGFVGAFDYGTQGGNPPWQQDHLACALVHAFRLGHDAAGEWLAWAADRWLLRRFQARDGWLAQDGAAYLVPHLDGAGQPITTWAAAAAEMQRRGWSNGETWKSTSGGNYGILAAQTLCELATVFPGRAEVLERFRWLCGAGTPHVGSTIPRGEPQSSVMPHGETRAAV